MLKKKLHGPWEDNTRVKLKSLSMGNEPAHTRADWLVYANVTQEGDEDKTVDSIFMKCSFLILVSSDF